MRWNSPFPALLLLAAVVFAGGCGRKAATTGNAEGWNLDPLHRAPHASYRLTVSGAYRGRLRIEILHQMLNGRSVIVQRQHRSGASSGMIETVFDAATFVPSYVQIYDEREGQLRETRLDYGKNRVYETVVASLFGGKDEQDTTKIDSGTFDDSELLTALRARPLPPGGSVTWTMYSSERKKAGEAEVHAEGVTEISVAGVEYQAQKIQVALFGENRTVWIEQGDLRRVLLVEGPGELRMEYEPS